MFQYRRKVKCMLDTIIVTPYHNDSIKFIPMSAKNIYDLPSSSMHRNIAISNFQLNFARQILSPHISDPSKKISPSTKQITGAAEAAPITRSSRRLQKRGVFRFPAAPHRSRSGSRTRFPAAS